MVAPNNARVCSILIPQQHQGWWDQKIVAPGIELLATYATQKNLPPAPASVTEAEFKRAIENAGGNVHFEDVFAMPEGFVALPRKFYDANQKNGGESWKQLAASFLPPGKESDTNSGIESYLACCYAVKDELRDCLLSHIKLLQIIKIKSANIKWNGKDVSNLKELVEAFYQNPTRELAEQIWIIYWGSIDSDKTFYPYLEYQMLYRLGIWYLPSAVCPQSRQAKTGKPCVGFVVSQARCTINDNHRCRFSYSSKDEIPHGIFLGKSQPRTAIVAGEAKRKYVRAKKGQFVWEKHVHGWNGDKHKQFKKEKEAKEQVKSRSHLFYA